MASFFSFLIHKRTPSLRTLRALLYGPVTPYRAAVYGFLLAIVALIFILLVTVHDSFLITVPARGGSITEGVIGAPKTINPVLATTEGDIALTRLVFAGLLKKTAEGDTAPELAENYDVSPDGLTYTFTLRPAVFHDGKPFTSRDVAFTVTQLQNSGLNPAQATYWGDVGIETPAADTVIFTLPSARSDFLDRATIGIIPEHIWTGRTDEEFLSAKQNLRPIGAGAFKITGVRKNNDVVTTLLLRRNPEYVQGAPLLKKLVVKIFNNQNELMRALQNDDIDMTSQLSAATLGKATFSSKTTIHKVPSATQATLYHLQGESGSLAHAGLVTVLSHFIDKEKIIAIVENGYGEPLDTSDTPLDTVEQASDKLATLGYRLNNGTLTRGGSPVGISIATTNDPQMVALAAALATELRTLGITVSIRSFDQGFFQAELSRNTFNAVLIKGIEPPTQRYEAAIPLYRTTIPFVTKQNAHAIPPTILTSPVLRYAEVNRWYINTDKLYSFLARNNVPITN